MFPLKHLHTHRLHKRTVLARRRAETRRPTPLVHPRREQGRPVRVPGGRDRHDRARR